MNKFEKARESLIGLVREQIIGPGAYNKQFFLLNKWDQNEFAGQKLSLQQSIKNDSEIIPELPAYQYSSAILFPEVIVMEEKESSENSTDGAQPDLEGESNYEDESADDEKIISKEMDGVSSKQQNYPNSFGLTFVVKEDIDLQNDIEITLKYRTYRKINKRDLLNRNFSLWVSENESEIRRIIYTYFKELFKLDQRDDNLFLSIQKALDKKDFYDIDYLYLNEYLENSIIPQIKSVFEGRLKTLEEDEKVIKIGVEEEIDIVLYVITKKREYGEFQYTNVYTIYDESLIRYIKNRFKTDLNQYSKYKELIKNIEVLGQIKHYLGQLRAIFKFNKPLSVWESSSNARHIVLQDFNPSHKIYRSQEPKLIESSDQLYYTLQYIRKSGKIYIKLIVLNGNQIQLGVSDPPQLNKKDEANQKSFFGIELKVIEIKNDVLQPYNPPQLLDFDEEDSFNKLIYRKYKDFGEGYNCSISWGKLNDKRFVSTEYLPEQETPKVGFIPKRINGSKIENRLKDQDILSFRFCSTLSENSDESIISGLKSFVDSYSIWITEKEEELDRITLSANERLLLEKQLRGCKKDQKRLNRNIKLLSKNKAGISSFRVMNTAMYMQLHHSISQKKQRPFIPNSNVGPGEEKYKDVDIPDYKWRSFQLAFILLNIDAFIKPEEGQEINEDIFQTGWPERNEIADLVWFPTGGGKTESYLGIIAFLISFRRFTKKESGFGTTVLMRYTLRLLTLQQFQRATLLICALEVIRKDNFYIPHNFSLGIERITIGLFVGGDSLPNTWDSGDKSMKKELDKISEQLQTQKTITTNIPFTDCPWCGGELFKVPELPNVNPNHNNGSYGINDQLNICCNTVECSFYSRRPSLAKSIPLRLFDDDIYKFPPTLLFGTVDKFANLANKVSTIDKAADSRRLFGKRKSTERKISLLPPELIIQDELHLLLGPLGSAVGVFERAIEHLCTYQDGKNIIRPKIITSTATTRNTDKQIFALFNRRAEIFPKQGIFCDDAYFSFYERKISDIMEYDSDRKYVGVLPVGKTQVWMQLRLASIALAHRVKYLRNNCSLDELLGEQVMGQLQEKVIDYYFTILSYYNSLKDVGKTQSQLTHYLPGDVSHITKNILPYNFLDKLIGDVGFIRDAELTGRLTGEEVKSSLSRIQTKWKLLDSNRLNAVNPPEFVMATNMISVGIDVGRFNTMLMNSMPRNIAEYIQATSRVARDEKGVVFTIHHPFRSRDISHYQKFKEFHEKFYSYVEPISVTPFAKKALDRYLSILLAVFIRHADNLELSNNEDAKNLNTLKIQSIQNTMNEEVDNMLKNAKLLDRYLTNREDGMKSNIEGIISEYEVDDFKNKVQILLEKWLKRIENGGADLNLKYRNSQDESSLKSLFTNEDLNTSDTHWKVGYSLREVGPSTVIRTVQQ